MNSLYFSDDSLTRCDKDKDACSSLDASRKDGKFERSCDHQRGEQEIGEALISPSEHQQTQVASNQQNVHQEVFCVCTGEEDHSGISDVATNHIINIDQDPATWTQLTSSSRDCIIIKGPPKNPRNFPRDKSNRAFPKSVFSKSLPNGEKCARDWLVWSKKSQSLLCFPCCLFQSEADEHSLLSDSSKGMCDNWRKLYDKVSQHESSFVHVTLYLKWKDAERSLKNMTGIDSSLQKSFLTEKEKWRKILRCMLDVILFLGERNLPLRGSSNQIGDMSNGLFLGTLELLSKYCPHLKEHLENVKSKQELGKIMKTHYLSWQTQNEFLKLCAEAVQKKVLDDVKNSRYYGLIVDGTPDVSHTEQLVFVLRYVSQNAETLKWGVKESFLELVDYETKRGIDIADAIKQVLTKNEIDLSNCRGQGYDNGSNMAGLYKGAQAIICKSNPQAIFSPCSAHSLNLCGVNAVESSVEVKIFFGNVQQLYNLFSRSPARWKILQETAQTSLHNLSETRWSARVEAVKPLVKRPTDIRRALERVKCELDVPADIYSEICGLLKWMNSFEFLLLALIWFRILQCLDDRNKILQLANITIDEEAKHIKSLTKEMEHLRGSWQNILDEARLIAPGLECEQEFKNTTWQKRKRKLFHDEQAESLHTFPSPEEHFKVNVFYIALDNLIGQLQERFKHCAEITERFSLILNPKENCLTSTIELQAKTLAESYPEDVDAATLENELRVYVKLCQGFSTSYTRTGVDFLNDIYDRGLENLIPQVCVCLRMFASIPVSVATGERTFSKLKIIKNYLRSTCGQERLNSLMILSVEKELAKKVDLDSVIDEFATIKSRKVNL